MKTPEARYLRRLQAVLLVGQGNSYSDVAYWLGTDAKTVEHWVKRVERDGAEALREKEVVQPRIETLDPVRRMLESDLKRSPVCEGYTQTQWDAPLLAAHLERKYATQLDVEQCRFILKRLARRGQEAVASAEPVG